MQFPMQRKGLFGRGTWSPPMVDHPDGMTNPVGTGEGLPQMQAQPQGPTFKQRLGGFLEGTVNDLMHMRGIQNTALDQRRALEMYKRQQQDEIAQYERRQQIEAQYDKPAQPHYWESNDGSLMSIGPDGQPVQVYQDKTPKPYMVTNADGTITPYIYNSETSQFQRVGVGGPTGSAGGMPPVKGKLKPYGGGTGSGSGNFPR